ncbi:hypothetical protein ACH5AU_30695 [Streptomyces albidoflavus]
MTTLKRRAALALAPWAALLIIGSGFAVGAAMTTAPSTVSFEDEQRGAGREFWGDVDGHKDCWAQVGDTSYVECRDGYLTSS